MLTELKTGTLLNGRKPLGPDLPTEVKNSKEIRHKAIENLRLPNKGKPEFLMNI
ncbi:MAG: hypothetical protein Roseis2KO_08270 [Roseivirga sp.]